MLTWRSTLPLPCGRQAARPPGRQHVDVVVVAACECDRFRRPRDRLARGGVPVDDSLGAVIDEAQRHPCEVRERLGVAVEERREVLAGGEAAERITRVRQRVFLGRSTCSDAGRFHAGQLPDRVIKCDTPFDAAR